MSVHRGLWAYASLPTSVSLCIHQVVLVHSVSSSLRFDLSHRSARRSPRGRRRLGLRDSLARKRFGFVAKLPLPEPKLRYEEIPLTARAEVTGQTLRAARIEKCSRATDQTIVPHCSRTRCRSDRAVTTRCPVPELSPYPTTKEPLVPFRCMMLPVAAINSHGWRFRLVRHSHGSDRPTRIEPENTASSGLSQKRKNPE